MPDLKLFRLSPAGPAELTAKAAQVEKSLQVLFEANLEGLLGVRLLASEYSTGKVHDGRIAMKTRPLPSRPWWYRPIGRARLQPIRPVF